MTEPIRLGPFKGANLTLEPKLLPNDVGVSSINHNPVRGDLRPWTTPQAVATVPSGRKTIYRFGRDSNVEGQFWFSWTTIVHAVRAFIADDTTERTYFTGSGAPKVADNTISVASSPYPTAARDLGVPVPTTAPTLFEQTAGAGTDETRFYIYVWVTDRGEVSAPSPVSGAIVCKPGAIIDIASFSSVPGGNHGINRIWIYRTVASEGGADFYFLREITSATTVTQDDGRQPGTDALQSNGPSGTTGRVWLPPPSDLKGLVGMWNGMMAGISGRSVRICEPFRFYAWPAVYETLPEDTPVALAVFQKNLVILTTGRPLVGNGSAPEAIDAPPVELIAPCVSVQSVASLDHGVVWASADGLAYVGSKGAPRLLTDGILQRQDWQALNPSTMVGANYLGWYVAFYQVEGAWKGFAIDPVNPQGIYFLDPGYSAVYADPLQKALYVLDGTSVKKWDAGGLPLTVTHKTKVFRTAAPVNFGAMELVASSYPWTVKIWADGTLRVNRSITSRAPFMLPSGFLADEWQLELSGQGALQGAVMAESVAELRPL